MNILTRWKAVAATVFALGAALALSACIISPGQFNSTFEIRRDGTFTYSYNGQIYLLALSKLAEMSAADTSNEEFVESPCYDEDSEEYEERPCTEEEIAEQRDTWEAQVQYRKESAEREAEQMRQFLGGIDPSDPQAAEELAERLRRQEGWKRVEYKGDGLFEVEFSLTSRMGHDFIFPTLERFPMTNNFVVANVRQGNVVRIEAPGFAAQGNANPLGGMTTGMSAIYAAAAAEGGQTPPDFPEMDGTFRIVTDGQILANNTDEGPTAGAGGQVLEWKVNARTPAPPMALIQLGS